MNKGWHISSVWRCKENPIWPFCPQCKKRNEKNAIYERHQGVGSARGFNFSHGKWRQWNAEYPDIKCWSAPVGYFEIKLLGFEIFTGSVQLKCVQSFARSLKVKVSLTWIEAKWKGGIKGHTILSVPHQNEGGFGKFKPRHPRDFLRPERVKGNLVTNHSPGMY